MIRRRILLGVLFAVVFALGWWVGRGRATGDLYGNLDVFVEALHRVQDNYVDTVEPEKLVDGALRGMLHELDPFSQYLDTRAYANLRTATEGSFGGIGIEVVVRDNYPTVIAPIEASPAWQAGIRSGDVIVKIDGHSCAGYTVQDAADHLRGPAGTHVSVAVAREGETGEHEYPLERQEIETPSVPYSFVVGDHVGYLRLSNFSEKSGAEVRAALDHLRQQGAKSLLLDLRFNPGGLLDQAVGVAQEFLPRGTLVVYTRGRARGQDNRFYASEVHPQLDWPLVVLVDGGTASASEIVAGALQDLDRALVVGHTSFGKGSVQSLFTLRGRGALKLTTALYYTPSGRSIHRPTRDSLAAANADDEQAAPGQASSPAVERPVYHTASGRTVYGGGGITPDLAVEADSLAPLARRVETGGLAFRFANRWVNTHPDARTAPRLTEVQWSEFESFLTAEKVDHSSAELSHERAVLERAMRRELARRLDGAAAAARVALEGDPVFERGLEVLSRAHSAREVFAAAGLGGAPERVKALAR